MKISTIKLTTLLIGMLFSCVVFSSQADETFSIVDSKEISFEQLGFNRSIKLQGSESNAYLGFGSRLDEIVSKASLDFSFIPSPALLAAVSHLKVYLNDELMGVIAIADGDQGKRVEATLPLDARFISNFNQLRFELIGSINSICRDPNDPSIWAEISKAGHIRLQVQKSILTTDLALFPAPFFDERDFSPVTLPFVFPSRQGIGELKAAGVLASYFGAQADWRGAHFPVYVDSLPQQHAVVFATNENKPAFIRDLPDVDGPTVQLITHPTNEYIKLLLVLGRDSTDLNMAVRGLALGKSLLTGSIARINSVTELQPRQPYDAPNWVRTDRSVSFAELVDDLSQLQVEGRTSTPINLSFNLPPDLFAWQSRGIPLDLAYRYSPPAENSGSRMSFLINGQFIEAFNLSEEGRNAADQRLRIPLLDDTLLGSRSSSHIPAFRIDSRNTMQFKFSFVSDSGDVCKSAPPSSYFAVMDSDSTLDFSGFSHYIKMPNLRAFAKSGFPFSRMADLSETAVVIKPQPSVPEIELLLDTMGLIGAKTGYPGLKVTMIDTYSPEQLADKDILTIGTIASGVEDVTSQEGAKLILSEMSRQLALPVQNNKLGWTSWLKPQPEDSTVTGVVDITAGGAFASMVAMESPFTASRSLISLVAASSGDFSLIGDALSDSGKLDHMFGSVVTIKNDLVASFDVGDTFYLGKLPVVDLIWFHFSEHPVLLALCAAVLVVLLTILIWRVLRQFSAKRLAEGGE